MPPKNRLAPAASASRSLPRLEAEAKPTPTLVSLSKIRRDGGTQMRPSIDPFRVEQIAQAIKDGTAIDPLEVVYDGSQYWLVNGFHRMAGYESAKHKAAPCLVTPGTQRDAVRLSLGANADQDKQPRSRETEQNAIKTALLDTEWGDSEKFSNREIARWVKVSEGTIRNWREKLAPQLEPDATDEAEPSTRMRVGKGGRTINTAKIGSAQKAAAKERQAAATTQPAATPPLPVATPTINTPRIVPPPSVAPSAQALLIQEGDSWNLDDHRVYCGYASDYRFQDVIVPAGLAFVTLTPHCYDTEEGFLEDPDYDWLAKYARTIAVLVQEASAVQPFISQTKLNYAYAMGCTLYNEWGYLAFFSQGVELDGDELDDADRSSPNQLFTALLSVYTKPHEAIIVVDGPQQGAFSPLVTCQELKRRCLLASSYKSDLQRQIANYNSSYAVSV